MRDDVVLEAIRNDATRWYAELTFRGVRYTMAFQPDYAGKLCVVVEPPFNGPFNWTIEGHEVGRLLERVRGGEALSLPRRVEPGPDRPRWPSAYDLNWNTPPLKEIWLVGAEKSSKRCWLARLRIDGRDERYEVEILPDGATHELRAPKTPSFRSYEYDLTGLLLRMNDGERFALPFKLRPRWPTPPDPPALP